MKRNDLVKRLLSETLLDMCERTNLSNITVKDLVKEAGISRQTFYNHFIDINDLIGYTATLPMLSKTDVSYTKPEGFCRLFDAARAHRGFYSQLPKQTGQNSFRDAYSSWVYAVYSDMVPANLPSDERQTILTELLVYAEGATMMLMKFLTSDMSTPNEIMAEATLRSMPKFVAEHPIPAGANIGYPR